MSWRPETDAFGATSSPLVAVAGDGAGIAGARAAVHRGRLAALDAAFQLGRISRQERDARARADLAALQREARLRTFLDKVYLPTESARRLADGTVACRCEEVTAGDLRQLIDEGFTDVNQLKSFSRCGMGQCQGRMCSGTIARILAEGLGTGPENVGHYRLRIPVKPLQISQLAELGHADRTSKPVLDVAEGDASQRI
jgi:bacterioferritin-associated ferredoxin